MKKRLLSLFAIFAMLNITILFGCTPSSESQPEVSDSLVSSEYAVLESDTSDTQDYSEDTSVEPQISDVDWEQAFYDYFSESYDPPSEYGKYELVDIGDEIPIVYYYVDPTVDTAVGYRGLASLFYYNDGQINVLELYGRSYVLYVKDEKKIMASGMSLGFDIYALESGDFCLKDQGGYDSDEEAYVWNGETVSEDEYDKLLDKAFDSSKSVLMEATYSLQEFLKLLNPSHSSSDNSVLETREEPLSDYDSMEHLTLVEDDLETQFKSLGYGYLPSGENHIANTVFEGTGENGILDLVFVGFYSALLADPEELLEFELNYEEYYAPSDLIWVSGTIRIGMENEELYNGKIIEVTYSFRDKAYTPEDLGIDGLVSATEIAELLRP